MVRFATICMSNQNRSMEAHHALAKKGLNVDSYGTNTSVRLPGPSANQPNVYSFGQTYEHMKQDLEAKDPHLYTQNGLLMLLERNARIKAAPQRFQETKEIYDVLICCEDRCWEMVCQELAERGLKTGKPVHVLNFDIKDTPEDATIAAQSILELAQQIEAIPEGCLDDQMEALVEAFQARSAHPMLYTYENSSLPHLTPAPLLFQCSRVLAFLRDVDDSRAYAKLALRVVDEIDAGALQAHLVRPELAEIASIYQAKVMYYEMYINASNVLPTETRQYITAIKMHQ